MRRRLLAFGTLLAVVGLVWAATFLMLRESTKPRDEVSRKVAEASRLLFYKVDEARTTKFRLDAGTTGLKVATHVLMPEGSTYDPERRLDYGVRLRLVDVNGQELYRRELSARTRQSKASPAARGWGRENAFTPDPADELTDRRDFDLELPPGLPRATLHVEEMSSAGKVLVRILSLERSNQIEKETKLASLPSVDDSERAASITYTPWELLRKEERAALVTSQWTAVPAEGESARDFVAQVVYYTGFRLAPDGDAASLPLHAGHHVALNVNGAARVSLRFLRPPSTKTGDAKVLEIESIGEGVQPGPWTVTLAAGEDEKIEELDLALGLRTLALRTKSPEGVLLEATMYPGRCVTEDCPPPRALTPDVRTLTQYTADSKGEPLLFDLGEPLDLASRMLRFDVRPLTASSEKVNVELVLVDDEGKEVTKRDVPVAAAGAPFESLRSAPEGLSVEAGRLFANEPRNFRFIVPTAARRLQVRTSVPSTVQVSVAASLAPSRIRFAPPYDELKSREVRWRYAPIIEEGWIELLPSNHRALSKAGRKATIAAQVRLERTGNDAALFGGAYPVDPRGAIERQTILERVPSDKRAALLSRWDGASFAELRPNAPVKLDFGERIVARPQLRFWLPEEQRLSLGTPVELFTDGERHTVDLRTTRGRQLLAPLPPGRHEIELKTPVESARLFVNRPPAPGQRAELFRVRTVYAVGAKPLTVPVKKPGTAPVRLYGVMYGPSEIPRTAVLQVRVDNGAPKRVSGIAVTRLTRADQTLRLTPAPKQSAATFMSHESGGELSSRLFTVTLGEDVAAGAHEITIGRVDGGDLWFRFFTSTPGEPDGDSFEGWTQEGWARVDSDGDEDGS